jgi:hypothetical protein
LSPNPNETERLLNNIKVGVHAANPFIPFSELLAKLSQDAEATASTLNAKTQKLIVLTRILVVMTGILIVLTIPIVIVESSKFFTEVLKPYLYPPQNHNHAGQNNQNPKGAQERDKSGPPPITVPIAPAVSPSGSAPTQKQQ